MTALNSALMCIARNAPLSETLTTIINGIEQQYPNIFGAIFLPCENGDFMHLGAAPSLHHRYKQSLVKNAGAGFEAWMHRLAYPNSSLSASEDNAANRFWDNFCNLALQHELHINSATPVLSSQNTILGLFVSYSDKPAAEGKHGEQAVADMIPLLVIAIERDIDKTKIEKAEAALQENNTRLALAIEGSATGIWDRDVPTGEIHYSTRWKAILGYSDDEIGTRIEESYTRVHPDDLVYVQKTIQDHFDQKTESYSVEHRLRCKDGSYKWVSSRGKVVNRDADGKPLRMIGTTTDITAMRSLSEKLQQNVDLITNLTNEVPGMVFQYRVSPDRVEYFPYVSQGIEEIYGLTPAQIAADASLIRSTIHPEDLAIYSASMESSAENLTPWHLEYRVILPNLGVRWRHGDARPRRLPDGSTLWHGFITDITDRKTARMLLEQTQDQLLQAEKLAAIGQLAAGVAHEINNPIGFVSSNLGQFVSYITDLFTLISKYEIGESQLPAELQSSIKALKKHIDIEFIREDVPQLLFQTKDGIDRVQEIVKSLRDFARVDSMHDKHFCDIHSGIESTLNIAWNTLKKKAAIHKEFDHTLPEIECVGSQINQVVLNLVVNAAQSIEGNGDIWIKTGRKDGKIFIAVTDTGIGIAPEIQARIFEPFFTTKPIGKGTGLGLSVSYGIVQKHGGAIEVKSQPGHGSTFTVWLPIQHAS